MSQISVNHLTFYYEGSFENIFEDVSFQIDTDWKLGFVARNGRGKTTFLNLLLHSNRAVTSKENSGKKEDYEYRGSISSAEKFDYFPFTVENPQKNTVALLEELYPDYEFWKVCRELSLLEVEADVLYRPFTTLSNGEQTKVMLAVLFSMEERFLLLDEPTNHLDIEARKTVKEYLRGKKGFILVSHDRDFLDECIDHVLVINKTNIEVYQGNFSSWWEQKKRQDAFELSENQRLKKDIKRLTEAARITKQWADNVEATKIGKKSEKYEKCKDTRAYVGEKSRRMQMRRKNLERRQRQELEEKSELLRNLEVTENLKLYPLRHHKEQLIRFEDVQIYYGEKHLKTLNFQLNNSDCIALQGKNGCGKSSVIKAILQEAKAGIFLGSPAGESGMQQCGTNIMFEGRIEAASGMVISYVPQDSSFLRGGLLEYARKSRLQLPVFLALLRKLDFNREQFAKNMEDYSAGQQKKVLIARSLCEQAHLYIWDEPLNYIDVFSRMQIEELLEEYRPTLLLVEHDAAFVDKLCNKVISCE